MDDEQVSDTSSLGQLVEGTPPAGGDLDKEITSSEFNNYRRFFLTFDTDCSGAIDVEEFKEILNFVGMPVEEGTISEIFSAAGLRPDLDHIDFRTFITLMASNKRRFASEMANHGANMDHIRRSIKHNCVLPDTPWRWAWDLAIMGAVVYYTVVVLFLDIELTGGERSFLGSWQLEVFLSSLLLADLVVTSRTSFRDANQLEIRDLKLIRWHYLKNTFIFDLAGALPLDLVARALGSYTAFVALAHLRLIRVGTFLLTHFQLSDRVLFSKPQAWYHFSAAPVLRLSFKIGLLVHLACVMRQISFNTTEVGDYLDALYYVLQTICGVGYGDMDSTSSRTTMLFSCVLFLAGSLVQGVIMGTFVTSVTQAGLSVGRRRAMKETLAVLDYFEIPHQLQSEILGFQNHVQDTRYHRSLDSLPPQMKDHATFYMRIRFINHVP